VTQQCNVARLRVDLDHINMRTVVEENVLWVEKVGFIESGRNAER
jgi:hypothetical protein